MRKDSRAALGDLAIIIAAAMALIIAIELLDPTEMLRAYMEARYLQVVDEIVIAAVIAAFAGMIFIVRLRQRRLLVLGRESTEMHRYSEELKRARDRYRLLFDNLTDAAFITDAASGKVIEVNRAAEEMLGRPRGEIVGRRQSELMPPGECRASDTLFRAHVRRGHPAVYEAEVVRGDGETLPVSISASAPAIEGRPVVLGLVRDISMKRRQEEELAAAAASLAYAQQLAGVGSWEWDMTTERVVMSEEGYRIFDMPATLTGYSYEEMLGRVNPDDVNKLKERLFKALFAGQRFEADFRIVRKPAPDMIVEARGEVAFDEAGVPVSMAGTVQDITERRYLEKKVLRLKRQAEQILEAAGEGIFGLSRDGVVNFINPAAAGMLGYRVQELIGRRAYDLIHHTDGDGNPLPESECRITATCRDGVVRKADEELFWRRDGSSFPVSYSVRPVKDNGSRQGAVVAFSDITRQKQMEAALRADSVTDDLTGPYNRRGFMTLARQQALIAGRSDESLLLFYADLDGMKAINDTYGHLEGDRALKEFASILKATFRESDIIARIGGDEFAVLAAGADSAASAVERLEEALERRNRRRRRYRLSLSYGSACYEPGRKGSLEELLAIADGLMYQQKRRKQKAS